MRVKISAKGRLLEAFRHLLGGREDKAALVVEYVEKRAGLLLDQGGRDGQQWFTFPHRTFQEFLAGCHLAGHPDFAAKALRLAEDDPGHWREVLKFAARQATASRGVPAADLLVGHQEVAGQSPSAMAFRKAVLAAEQLLEIGLAAVSGDPNHDVIRRRVAGWLVALLERGSLPAKERVQAGDLLAKLGDPRVALVPGQLEDLGAMEFCLVPVGPFIMGDRDERHRNDLLDRDFWISRHPVTVAQFDLFVQAGGYGMAEFWPEAQAAEVWKAGEIKGRIDSEWRDRPNDYGDPFNLPNHPVVGLTWYEALAFTRWLNAGWRGRMPAGCKLNLPSEAEWEKAARGGERLCQPRVIRPLGALGSMEAGRSETAPNPQAERTYPWVIPSMRTWQTVMRRESAPRVPPGVLPRVPAPAEPRTWRAMSGSGPREACQTPALCGAVRSSSHPTSRAVPTATGAIPSTGSASSVSGWWRPHSNRPTLYL